MSEGESVALPDIKHCVVCSSEVSLEKDEVKCLDILCGKFTVAADRCKSQLNSYAKNGSMNFCYACGSDMKSEEDFIVCGDCKDPIKYSVPSRLMISIGDVKCCVMCGEATEKKGSASLQCSSKAKCKFRITGADSLKVTETLQEYSRRDMIKFCYACGSSTYRNGECIICTREDCSSASRSQLPIRDRSSENTSVPKTDSGATDGDKEHAQGI